MTKFEERFIEEMEENSGDRFDGFCSGLQDDLSEALHYTAFLSIFTFIFLLILIEGTKVLIAGCPIEDKILILLSLPFFAFPGFIGPICLFSAIRRIRYFNKMTK